MGAKTIQVGHQFERLTVVQKDIDRMKKEKELGKKRSPHILAMSMRLPKEYGRGNNTREQWNDFLNSWQQGGEIDE